MRANLLILAGTTEATAFARAAEEAGLHGTVSFAGRVARPLRQALPQRVGGFGGPAGLARWLAENGTTHVIDATHPFAAQMSAHAVEACRIAKVPLVALTRPEWTPVESDKWISVPDIPSAVAALAGPPRRVVLAIGRMHLADFAPHPQHSYLLRLVDPPDGPLPFPDAEVVVDRGPFSEAGDRALLTRFRADLVVSKNAGGTGAYAKLAAARSLGLPVLMIERPPQPRRATVTTVSAALDWVAHAGTDLGV